MNFIVNRNGGINARYFLDTNQEFDPSSFSQMRQEIAVLVDMVLENS